MSQPEHKNSVDPILALARVARMDTPPKTSVTTDVLRQIRLRNTLLAEKTLLWMALGSTAAAVAVATVSIPVLMSLLDPLNALFQSTPTSLL
jgi:spore coat protein CotF